MKEMGGGKKEGLVHCPLKEKETLALKDGVEKGKSE